MEALSKVVLYSMRFSRIPISEGLMNFAWVKAVIFENASV